MSKIRQRQCNKKTQITCLSLRECDDCLSCWSSCSLLLPGVGRSQAFCCRGVSSSSSQPTVPGVCRATSAGVSRSSRALATSSYYYHLALDDLLPAARSLHAPLPLPALRVSLPPVPVPISVSVSVPLSVSVTISPVVPENVVGVKKD